MHEGTPNFDQIVEEGAFMPVDGELPWGTWSMNKENGDANGWIIDGKKTARQLFLEHYTSLSVIHNYKERGAPDKYSMMYWKETPISEEYLKEKHMPVSDGYFRKHDGSAAQRNAFEYVRDHLGYRLELQELQIDTLKHTDNHILNLSLTLINRGFSTLFNEHPVYFVLVDEHNQVKEFLTNADTNSFQPYRPGDKTYTPLIHTIKGQVTLPRRRTALINSVYGYPTVPDSSNTFPALLSAAPTEIFLGGFRPTDVMESISSPLCKCLYHQQSPFHQQQPHPNYLIKERIYLLRSG